MEFADKLRYLRKQKGLTQAEAAQGIGVSLRTYKSYELGHTIPRSHHFAQLLANFYNVTLEQLFKPSDKLLPTEAPKFSTSKNEAISLVQSVSKMFAGGDFSERDKEYVMMAIQKAYWDAKAGHISAKDDIKVALDLATLLGQDE